MTYVAAHDRPLFLAEAEQQISQALRDGDPDRAATLMVDASIATLGDFEPTEIMHSLGRRLALMDEEQMRRVAAIIAVAERQAQRH